MKERHYSIIKNLIDSNVPISAKELAKKNKVSLRTIRNDLKEISDFVKQNNGVMLSVPGVGTSISYLGISLDEVKKKIYADGFIRFTFTERSCVLVYLLMNKSDYIPSMNVAELLDISQSLVFKEIKKINRQLETYRLTIIGEKNKGLKFNGSRQACIKFINDHNEIFETEFVYQLLWGILNDGLVSISAVYEVITNLERNKSLKVTNYELLVLNMLYLLNCSTTNEISSHTKNQIETNSTLKALLIEIKNSFGMEIPDNIQKYLTYILTKYTHQVEEAGSITEEKLVHAISRFIIDFQKDFGKIDSDIIGLTNDLYIHLCSLKEASLIQVSEPNPLLPHIKTRYFDVFSSVKNSVSVLEEELGFAFTEDQIGYLVLYFVKCLEKKDRNESKKAIIICNSGRGSAKLLESKIRNTLPEITILTVESLSQFRNRKELSADIIITTVNITHKHIPVIKVSPLLHEKEIQNIRGVIYDSKALELNTEENQTNELESISFKTASLSETYALIVLEAINLFKELKNEETTLEQLSGISTHILMSIRRWEQGIFLPIDDYDSFKKNMPKEVEICQKHLEKISDILSLYIPTTEVVPIIRYFL